MQLLKYGTESVEQGNCISTYRHRNNLTLSQNIIIAHKMGYPSNKSDYVCYI